MKSHRYFLILWTLAVIATPVLAQGQSNVPELQKLQKQHAKSVAQVQQESKAKIDPINQQYDQALDALLQKLTRAGNLDGALAVREEKKRLTESVNSGDVSGGTSPPKLPPPELQKLQQQHAKSVAQIEQESKAKIDRINQQYDQALDALIQKLTRAENLDGALAVREEKKRLTESINSGVQDGYKSRENTIIEGKGWKFFHLGATRDELVQAFGQPDNDSTPDWLRWKTKHHIHCLYDDSRGAWELRFDEGFKDGLPTGIKLGSSEDKMRKAYGEPEDVTDKGNGEKRFEYSNKGVLFNTRQGKIFQIVVFKPI